MLVTFGLLFVFQGLAIVNWGGEYRGYSYLAVPVKSWAPRCPQSAARVPRRLRAGLPSCS